MVLIRPVWLLGPSASQAAGLRSRTPPWAAADAGARAVAAAVITNTAVRRERLRDEDMSRLEPAAAPSCATDSTRPQPGRDQTTIRRAPGSRRARSSGSLVTMASAFRRAQ